IENGIAVVASVGNEGFNQAAFPAGNQGVISVGSIDATGFHMSFSNLSDSLSITAPGYGVTAAWPGELDDRAISFTGTSASAPFVSGAIAAVMSQSDVPLTPMQAWDIVQNYTNESGAPGADSYYGNGLLNVGQVIQRDTSGIYDLAVAQPYYDTETNMLQITVENRGTESFGNGELTVNAGGGNYPLAINSLGANESRLFVIPIGSSSFNTDGSLSVGLQTTINSNVVDSQPRNNQRRDTLSVPTD
ncbi:S8 family serine peptidase, partial [Akkermansiaceae bacterium]|nr:S8 family serine peptidase [Akkermansiaceae bacterium]